MAQDMSVMACELRKVSCLNVITACQNASVHHERYVWGHYLACAAEHVAD